MQLRQKHCTVSTVFLQRTDILVNENAVKDANTSKLANEREDEKVRRRRHARTYSH